MDPMYAELTEAERLTDLFRRAARCRSWHYAPGMAILRLTPMAEPIRIVAVFGDCIRLYVPGLGACREIGIDEAPVVDLSDPATFAIVASTQIPIWSRIEIMDRENGDWNGGRTASIPDLVGDLVAAIEHDLPF